MSAVNFLKLVINKFRAKPNQKMASLEIIQRLEGRALQAENLIASLKAEVLELQKASDFCQQNIKLINLKKFDEIKSENIKLKKEVEEWKNRLIETEKKMGILCVQDQVSTMKNSPDNLAAQNAVEVSNDKEPGKKKEKVVNVKEPSKKATDKSQANTAKTDDLPVDVARLDIRVGRIVSVKKHPDADSLYVEEVDLGEGKPRTVVSGLVKYVPIEEMENRMVVALCNLKPAKMRGITSEAMVLCASTPEKVEVLTPPKGSQPGDKVVVEGYAGDPDPVLNPKKKIFETVAPDLKTDGEKVATYKGIPFTVLGKGVVVCQSLTDVQIK